MVETMVTTIDNPYDYFTQFDEWYAFDISHGYDTCGYLARIANVASDMSEEVQNRIINDAVDEICRMNLLGIYKKVTKEASN